MSLSFSDEFWGAEDKGLEFIRQWVKSVTTADEEFLAMISQRISIEEDYGKRLSKLMRLNLGHSEVGTTKNAIDTFNLELERSARIHSNLASDIKEQIEIPIKGFMTQMESERKNTKEAMKAALKNRITAHTLAIKANEKYESRCRDYDLIQSQKHTISPKDLEKHESKIKKAHVLMDDADKEYKAAVEKANEAYDSWVKEIKQGMQKLQDIEQLRLNQLKVNLMLLSNLFATAYSKNNESFDNVRQSLERCSVTKDIDLFIEQYGTGRELPPRLVYKNQKQSTTTETEKPAATSKTPAPSKGGIISDLFQRATGKKPTAAPAQAEEIWSAENENEEEEEAKNVNNAANIEPPTEKLDDLLFENTSFGETTAQ